LTAGITDKHPPKDCAVLEPTAPLFN